MAQKFTGGIGNKLCGECPGTGAGKVARSRPAGSKPSSHLCIRVSGVGVSWLRVGGSEGAGPGGGLTRPVLGVLTQPCSTETPRSRRRAAGANPRGSPPGRPPAPATRSPAAAPKRMSTTGFSTQQVNAPRGARGRPCPSLCPAHLGWWGPGAENPTGASRWRRRLDLPESLDESEKCGTCPLGPSPRTWPLSSKRALRPWRSSPSAALGVAGGR